MNDNKSRPFPPRIADAYKSLAENPQLTEMLLRHIKQIEHLADEQRCHDAASVVMDSAVKAIVDFDIVRAEWAWVMRHVKWGLLTFSRMHRPGAVRDAYTAYVSNNLKGPTLKQLAKAADLNPREVLAVWHLVAEELKIDASMDTVVGSLPPCIHGSLVSSLNIESMQEFFVLSKHLDPLSYALLLLTYLFGRSADEIRRFAAKLRQMHADGVSKDGLEAEIHAFAAGFGEILGLEWTDDWLELKTNGQIRVRIHRAKIVLRKSGGSGDTQHFAA